MELDLRGTNDRQPVILPFTFDVVRDTAGLAVRLHNGEEIIALDEVLVHGDSIHMRPALFDTEFIGVIQGDSVIRGLWYNRMKGPHYAIPFVARAGDRPRFHGRPADAAPVAGTWACRFAVGTSDAYDAMGLFHTEGGRVLGTFATETGDHRFLEGVAQGDSLVLSAFDGSHAYLYRALLRNDSLIGEFRSGVHAREAWTGIRDPDFHLRDPDSLTFLKAGHHAVQLRLTDLDGDTVALDDPRFSGHVRMVQIMGSWCTNCMDESRLLAEVYQRHHARGLDIVAVAFERRTDPVAAIRQLKRYKERLAIPYDILYGGQATKGDVARTLPFLDQLMSYPTCIFIDRQGRVRRIRTGFYGPGTGSHHQAYRQELDSFLDSLLSETAPPPLGG